MSKSRGYINYNLRNANTISSRTTIAEHRWLLKDLGIDLTGKVVHHIDGDKENNNPNNLEIMTQGEHTRLHWGIQPSEPLSHEYIQVVCPACGKAHSVMYAHTRRKNYTGQCRSCGQEMRWRNR